MQLNGPSADVAALPVSQAHSAALKMMASIAAKPLRVDQRDSEKGPWVLPCVSPA